MTRLDDDQLLARFDDRLARIEAEVPTPGPWRPRPAPATQLGSGSRLFSVTKLAVAGLVIALFGGFLIAGILPGSQEDGSGVTTVTPGTSPTDELLAGFTLEELEPGVLHVVNDGVRELAFPPDVRDPFPTSIVAGLDGSIWVVDGDELIRLGEDVAQGWPDVPTNGGAEDVEVGPDGRLWVPAWLRDGLPQPQRALWTLGEDGWSAEPSWLGPESPISPVHGVEVTSDGAVYASTADGVLRVDGIEPGEVSPPFDPSAGSPGRRAEDMDFAVSTDGTRWLLSRSELAVHRDDGSGWQQLDLAGLGHDVLPPGFRFGDDFPVAADVGPDGTLWIHAQGTLGGRPYAALFAGAATSLDTDDPEWRAWSGGDDPLFPPVARGGNPQSPLVAGPDGRAWIVPLDPGAPDTCFGITELDSSDMSRHLHGLCVHAFDVAPDGTVWILAGPARERTAGPISIYVIRPDLAKLRVTIKEPATDQRSPAELVTEYVEPGVTRVISDGHRDVSWMGPAPPVDDPADPSQYPGLESRVHVRPDGRVTVVLNSEFYELGQETTHRFAGRDFMVGDEDELAVDAEGTLYKRLGWRPNSWSEPMGKHELWSFDGSGWSQEDFAPGIVRKLASATDGSVWAETTDGVFRKDPGGWTLVTEPAEGVRGSTFAVVNDDTRWLAGPGARFFTDRGEGWVPLRAEWPEALNGGENVANVGPDGTLWVHARAHLAKGTPALLARYQDGEWAAFDDADSTPAAIGYGFGETFEVAADGSVWLNPGDGSEGSCAGLASFDGISWEHYLEDLCIHDLDIGPDGLVWATAGPPSDDGRFAGGLYFIDPR